MTSYFLSLSVKLNKLQIYVVKYAQVNPKGLALVGRVQTSIREAAGCIPPSTAKKKYLL